MLGKKKNGIFSPILLLIFYPEKFSIKIRYRPFAHGRPGSDLLSHSCSMTHVIVLEFYFRRQCKSSEARLQTKVLDLTSKQIILTVLSIIKNSIPLYL